MRKFVFIIIALALGFFLLRPLLPHHPSQRAQAAWLRSQAQHLQNLGAPPMMLATNREPNDWAKDGFLVFSNGWAAFTCHTIHDSDAENIQDIALLRTADGDFYVSRYHFCMGETTFTTKDRPGDFSQFLALYGAEQGWTRDESLEAVPDPTHTAPASSTKP